MSGILIGVDKAAYTKQSITDKTELPSDMVSSGTGTYADWSTSTSSDAWVKLITSGGANIRLTMDTTDIESDVVTVVEGVVLSGSNIEVELNLNKIDANVWADLLGATASSGGFDVPATYNALPIVNFAVVSRTVDGKHFLIWFKKAVAILNGDGSTDNAGEYKYTITFRAVADYETDGTPKPVVYLEEVSV